MYTKPVKTLSNDFLSSDLLLDVKWFPLSFLSRSQEFLSYDHGGWFAPSFFQHLSLSHFPLGFSPLGYKETMLVVFLEFAIQYGLR